MEEHAPSMPEEPKSLTSRVVAKFLDSNFSILLILLALALGLAALLVTPREEDPQIVVPVIDVAVEAPGTTAEEAQKLAAIPLERLFWEIKGVEHVYSMTSPGRSLVTVRFEVGEDREKALVNVYNKIQSNLDRVPPQVSRWIVKPVEIDDVPILTLTLYSRLRGESELVRFADELSVRLQEVPDSSRITIHGGHRRKVRVLLDLPSLEAKGMTPLQVARALGAADRNRRVGTLVRDDSVMPVEVGPFLESASEAAEVIVGVVEGRPVRVRDVARVVEDPGDPETYTRIRFGRAALGVTRGDPVDGDFLDGEGHPAVTLAVAKRKGTNAVVVAEDLLRRFEEIRDVLPSDVRVQVTRNYGETADEKVNELIGHLLIAVGTIVVLVGASLGWSAAFIVALAVPLTLAVTLFGDLAVGYTINRVTLFALILSLGLLVDDPIVDVENIHRHLARGGLPARLATLIAVDEVRPPTILATFTVIVSFLPMFFVTGMMGPYMRPMPFNVPAAMLLSLIIAFTVTPWAAFHLLRKHAGKHADSEHGLEEGFLLRGYRAIATLLFRKPVAGLGFLFLVLLAFGGSVWLAVGGKVPMKMLPFDNKSEFQIVVDAPEGWSLERTDRLVRDLAAAAAEIPECTDVESYVGHASPHDFNGLVRHYFLRRGPSVADLRINLLPRHQRARQSHEIVLASRPVFEEIARKHGAAIKIVETPPGPPVLAGVVAEVYGPEDATPADIQAFAENVRRRFEKIDYLHDVDTMVEADRRKLRWVVDRDKAAMRGIDTGRIVQALGLVSSGMQVGAIHAPGERLALPLEIGVERADRSTKEDLSRTSLLTRAGTRVPLAELVRPVTEPEGKTLFRKDLRDVQYVLAEPVGKSPVDAVFALQDDLAADPPPEGFEVEFAGEGEWQVTVDVFRDLGLAFAGALAGIYILLVAQIGSFAVSGLIMLAIPLTMIGIFPGFWLLNSTLTSPVGAFANPIFFTATGMIGMIALAGIVVRNSIILIDFVHHHEAKGMSTVEACIEAGVIRLRPILLTAGAAVLGAWVIVFDPIFSGLAWSFVFGILASTAFTVFVIPLAYIHTRPKRA